MEIKIRWKKLYWDLKSFGAEANIDKEKKKNEKAERIVPDSHGLKKVRTM